MTFPMKMVKKDQLETKFFHVVQLYFSSLGLFAQLLNSIVRWHLTIGTHYKSISSQLHTNNTYTHMCMCMCVCVFSNSIWLFINKGKVVEPKALWTNVWDHFEWHENSKSDMKRLTTKTNIETKTRNFYVGNHLAVSFSWQKLFFKAAIFFSFERFETKSLNKSNLHNCCN